LRVWIHAPRWRPEAAFRTWFYRIVFNLALNRKRRAPFAPLEAAGDPADPAIRADAALLRAEEDRRIADAIAALPARQRSAIALTYNDELSNAEAANVLGTSVSAFETLLVRARRTLRVKLDLTDDD
jgi:RNA polymerase sigma-70 factor (ECF subfamily)